MNTARWISAALVTIVLAGIVGWTDAARRSDRIRAFARLEAANGWSAANTSADPARTDSDSREALAAADALLGGAGAIRAIGETRIDAELLITTVARQPAWSTALIAVQDDPARVFGIGDRLASGTVHGIERGRVFLLREDGALEVLTMGSARGDATPASPAPTRQRVDWRDGVTKVDDTHFEVTSAAIENALAHLDELKKGARVTPDFRDGALQGYRVFRIRKNSAAQALGLHDNDVITRVDGVPIDPAALLGRIHELTSVPSLELEVVRGGAPVVLEYTIH
jgi:membrane-associated protease RseP (regulator of RpoE activity)